MGNYIKGDFIGKGGFGEVYKARHRYREKPACMKIIRADRQSEDLIDFIMREAKVLDRLDHPHIVRLQDLDIKDDEIYLIMDYIDGGDLADVLKAAAGPLAMEDVDDIIKQIAEGLHYAHQQQIIHRDLKPKNILRDKDGRVVIADFGLAKVVDTALSQTSLSWALNTAGTPAYMAPEHFDGRPSYQSDLYSLGIITYQLLTNRVPFPSDAQEGHRHRPPPSLLDFNREITPEIEQVVLKMLSKAPEERYQSPIEFWRALHSAIARKDLKIHIDPGNIREWLSELQDDRTISLSAGEYKGPFTINKRLRLIGTGASTVLYCVDEPVLQVGVSGVRLENMVIKRTVESGEEAAIQGGEQPSGEQITYELKHVTVMGGQTEGAIWEDTEWQLPVGGIDFGRIPLESKQTRQVEIEVKDWSTVATNLQGLEVFPNPLAPGPHTLVLEFNASGRLPGTLLDGSSISFQSPKETREIRLSGRIERIVAQTPPIVLEEHLALPQMVWSYQLWDEAASNLLRVLGGDAGKELLAQWQTGQRTTHLRQEIANRAIDLLTEMGGREGFLWYVSRLRVDEDNLEEEIWELTLATDSPTFPQLLAGLKKTVCLKCKMHREGKGRLKIVGVRFLAEEEGYKNLVSLPVLIRLTSSVQGYTGISQELIEQIRDLPIESHHELDANQLKGWQALLDFQSGQTRKGQYWIGYTGHSYREGTSRVTFFLDKEDARNSEKDLIPYQDFFKRALDSRTERLKLFPALPTTARSWRWRDQEIGTLEQLNQDKGTFEISLMSKRAASLRRGADVLPPSGYLHFDAGGEMAQINQHQDALEDLKQGKSTNPLLADFFFDATKARKAKVSKHLQPSDLLSGTCNSGQIAAIEAALAVPDLLLIQGPPGTGKTTVIAEICYQVALGGGRTLIASQSNLAVDNALSRIMHSPQVRALRKGNIESVESEGLDFTEERVVQKWLINTAGACQSKLEKRNQNIAFFKDLLDNAERFARYSSREIAGERVLEDLQLRQKRVAQNISAIEARIAQQLEEEQRYLPLQRAIAAIQSGMSALSETEIDAVFQYLLAETADKRLFIGRINEGLSMLKEAGLTPPAGGQLLRCAVWLKETVDARDQSWSKSEQLLRQTWEEIASLRLVAQSQTDLAQAIKEKKKQVEGRLDQINALFKTMQGIEDEQRGLARAQEVLKTLPADGGSVSSILREQVSAEINAQLAAPHPFSALEMPKIFPAELVVVLMKKPGASLLDKWRSAEQAIHAQLQKHLPEIKAYFTARDKLAYCGRYLDNELAAFSAEKQQAREVQPAAFQPIQDSTAFLQQVSQLENRLRAFHEARDKNPEGFLSEQRQWQVLGFLLENNAWRVLAQKSENSIYGKTRTAITDFITNIARELFAALKQWFNQEALEIDARYQELQRQKTQLREECQELQRQYQEEEEQAAQKKVAFETSAGWLADLLREVSRRDDLPQSLRALAQRNASGALAFAEEYGTAYQRWTSETQRLRKLVAEFWQELKAAGEKLQGQLVPIQGALEEQQQSLSASTRERDELEAAVQSDAADLSTERQWWQSLWETIPEKLRPTMPGEGIFSYAFLETVQHQFSSWQHELEIEEKYARQYNGLIADWVKDLGTLSESDRQELQNVYIKNANVIGITCGQVYKLSAGELRKFASFNVVIIDEVSKATPPELLLPALKGKKLILIGDHHQLPPMIEDKTLDQMAEENDQDPASYRYLNQPYFAQRYNEAAEENKRMLSIQYRMHPDIMAAINQFYERPLECGLNKPEIERDHQLESGLVRKSKHLIWVTTPLVPAHGQGSRSRKVSARNKTTGREVLAYQSRYEHFGERKVKTSYVNEREVEIIERICTEFQRIWSLKRAEGFEPKDIGIITFYAEQARLLRETLLPRSGKDTRFDALNIRIGTVDSFQGMERAVIIVSMVRNNTQRDIGFAKRDERINVAFSRAQQLLMIVGCHDLFCNTTRREQAAERYSHVSRIVKNRGEFIDVSSI
ncbi:MAG TPA: AAA domain-containing protein [Ktedonobacteraceae bacterium]